MIIRGLNESLNNDCPALIDRVVLHAPTNTLRVYAHTKQPLNYASYSAALRALYDSATALGDIPKEIMLQNELQSAEEIARFCMDALHDRLAGLVDEQSIMVLPESGIVSADLLCQRANMASDDLAALDGFISYFSVCFHSMTIRFNAPKDVAVKSDSEQNRVYRTVNASKKRRTKQKNKVAARHQT